MKISSIVSKAILASVALDAPKIQPSDDLAANEALFADLTASIKAGVLASLDEREASLRKRGQTATCTAKSISFRREYGSLSKSERLAYVNAVKCLQRLPPQTPANVSSGARSRFDDFTVTHIQQTMTIHYTGNFMPWHRWFVHLYEKALREECGYTGYQPYWDWPKYASAPEKSPIFNGDPYSLGGNGEYVPHDGPVIVPPAGVGGSNIQLPAGVGGGFVTTGPFANMTVHLGPVGGLEGTTPGPDGGLGYNPRGLKRDVGPAMNERYANYTTVLSKSHIATVSKIAAHQFDIDLLLKPNISEYRLLSEGADLFTSPGDPAFWVHHGMMDRLWTLWQAIDPVKRHKDLNGGDYGHVTWANSPASDKTQLTDVIEMGYTGPSIKIEDVMDTLSGPFCYFYL
ncbi:hypothetical protein EsH8_II_000634 [Colletotrichum jinshuiense]